MNAARGMMAMALLATAPAAQSQAEPVNQLLFLRKMTHTPPAAKAEDFDTTDEQRALWRAKGLPVITRRIPPLYPKSLAHNRTSGCVVVAMMVTEKGVADSFRILSSNPLGAFDKAALDALYHWEFEPGRYKGSYVQSFSFGFEIDHRSMHRIKGPSPPTCDIPDVWLTEARFQVAGRSIEDGFAPYYPPEAVQEKVEGCVSVSFDITPEGLADNYELIQSNPAGRFDKATIWALNQWRFDRAEKANRAAVTYYFDLRPETKAAAIASGGGCGLPAEFAVEMNTVREPIK